jgi:hypothetical protein
MEYKFKGIKLVGLKDHAGQCWKVTADCIYCGQCCLDKGTGWHFADDEGKCVYAIEHTTGAVLCGLKGARPFSCCINDPHATEDYCAVKLEKCDCQELNF